MAFRGRPHPDSRAEKEVIRIPDIGNLLDNGVLTAEAREIFEQNHAALTQWVGDYAGRTEGRPPFLGVFVAPKASFELRDLARQILGGQQLSLTTMRQNPVYTNGTELTDPDACDALVRTGYRLAGSVLGLLYSTRKQQFKLAAVFDVAKIDRSTGKPVNVATIEGVPVEPILPNGTALSLDTMIARHAARSGIFQLVNAQYKFTDAEYALCQRGALDLNKADALGRYIDALTATPDRLAMASFGGEVVRGQEKEAIDVLKYAQAGTNPDSPERRVFATQMLLTALFQRIDSQPSRLSHSVFEGSAVELLGTKSQGVE